MTTRTLEEYLASQPAALAKGPIAIILIEDSSAVAETLLHHLRLGFRHILALSPEPIALPEDPKDRITNLIWNTRHPDAHVGAINAVSKAVAAGTWLYYCYNAEFLFFPFSESRRVGEMLAFHTEERRDAMLTYIVDLYASDLTACPDAVDLDNAMFDRTGYYALGRPDENGHPQDRQLDFHGGLRWRFEEFVPPNRRRIDRIGLFRARHDLSVSSDHRFNIQEYNTYSCQWHHNLTAAITSFRVAKALVKNPGSRDQIDSFVWRGSHRFDWTSQQLMDLGLTEPGQWF